MLYCKIKLFLTLSLLSKSYFSEIYKYLKFNGDKKRYNFDSVFEKIRSDMIQREINSYFVNELLERIKKVVFFENVKLSEEDLLFLIREALNSSIIDIFGDKATDIEIEKNQLNIIPVIGSYGVGKTSFISKLANRMNKNGFNVSIGTIDRKRKDCVKQIKTLANLINVKYIERNEDSENLIDLTNSVIEDCEFKNGILFLDTEGICFSNKLILQEMNDVFNKISANHCLLICDSLNGNYNEITMKNITENISITGSCLTKCDGDVNFGNAINIRLGTLNKIYYQSYGEDFSDIKLFNSISFANNITDNLLFDEESYKFESNQKISEISFFENLKNSTENKKQKKVFENIINFVSNINEAEIKDPILISNQRKKYISDLIKIDIDVINNFISVLCKFNDNKNLINNKTLIYEDLIL